MGTRAVGEPSKGTEDRGFFFLWFFHVFSKFFFCVFLWFSKLLFEGTTSEDSVLRGFWSRNLLFFYFHVSWQPSRILKVSLFLQCGHGSNRCYPSEHLKCGRVALSSPRKRSNKYLFGCTWPMKTHVQTKKKSSKTIESFLLKPEARCVTLGQVATSTVNWGGAIDSLNAQLASAGAGGVAKWDRKTIAFFFFLK